MRSVLTSPRPRVHHLVNVVRHLTHQPFTVALQEIGSVELPAGSEQERHAVDPVVEDVDRLVEVVDRGRDVAIPAPPRLDRPLERAGHRVPVAIRKARKRDRAEADVTRPELVEVAAARREASAVPAVLDGCADDAGGVARIPLWAEDRAPDRDDQVHRIRERDPRSSDQLPEDKHAPRLRNPRADGIAR
jgi:hypothetical protein